jgi:type II secretory pathway pseudopilin PulG
MESWHIFLEGAMDKTLFKRIFRRHKSAGFTLIELLVTTIVSTMVISGLLYLVVQLMDTDKKEFARAETAREMSMALDYMASDLQEAVYVYEGECLTGRGNLSDSNYCPGIVSNIGLASNNNVKPILAFWKLESLPYSETATGSEALPTDCENNFSTDNDKKKCRALLITRNSYTLVVYSLRTDNYGSWDGPARITRYQLRQYAPVPPANLSTMTVTPSYIDPTAAGSIGFQIWPCDKNATGATCPAQQVYSEGGATNTADVLVDLVDTGNLPDYQDLNPNLSGVQPCPEPSATTPTLSTYSLTSASNNTSFYACVRRPSTGQSQDVIVYLRGNAAERAGQKGNRDSSYLPQVQAQVQTRSVFGRTPPQL